MVVLQIPSPPISSFALGPVTIHIYALCLLAGIITAAWWSQRRFVSRGGEADQFQNVILVAIVFGIIGARIYHVITDYQLYFGPGRNPWDALKIWNGGLGIWGAVAFGGLGAWLAARHYGINFAALADVIAPTLLLGQGIGRLGNWFNQELFGRPTDLPWGLAIDASHRPAGYEQYATFHPTFLYEMVWTLPGALLLAWAEKRFKLGYGKLFCLYICWYTFGRFFVEALRIDPVNHVGGFRLNNYTSIIVFAIGALMFTLLLKRHPGAPKAPFAKKINSAGDSAVSSRP